MSLGSTSVIHIHTTAMGRIVGLYLFVLGCENGAATEGFVSIFGAVQAGHVLPRSCPHSGDCPHKHTIFILILG